jgi:hypothetical protein
MEDWRKKNIPWDSIKSYWKNELKSNVVFTDDEEHIIVFNDGEKFIVICYLHFYINRLQGIPTLNFNEFEKFIDYVKSISEREFINYKIIFLCNRHLAEIKDANKINLLPKDFDYYHIDYNEFYKTLKVSKHELESVLNYSKSLEKKDRPWYHNKNIRVIESNKYHDWDVWHNKGYEREWFDFRDAYRFDDFYLDADIHFADFSIIDERLYGFYLIWKNFDLE